MPMSQRQPFTLEAGPSDAYGWLRDDRMEPFLTFGNGRFDVLTSELLCTHVHSCRYGASSDDLVVVAGVGFGRLLTVFTSRLRSPGRI
jgi:hypothetical protein